MFVIFFIKKIALSQPKNATTLTPNGKKKALVKIVEKNGFKNSLFYSKY